MEREVIGAIRHRILVGVAGLRWGWAKMATAIRQRLSVIHADLRWGWAVVLADLQWAWATAVTAICYQQKGGSASRAQTLLDDFLSECEENAELSIQLFGDWDVRDGQPHQIKEGIFSKEQFAVLWEVHMRRLPPDALDVHLFASGGPRALTLEQVTKAHSLMTDGAAAGFMELLSLRRKAQRLSFAQRWERLRHSPWTHLSALRFSLRSRFCAHDSVTRICNEGPVIAECDRCQRTFLVKRAPEDNPGEAAP